MAEPLMLAHTQAVQVIATTVLLMYLRPLDNTEAEKTAPPVPINQPTHLIQRLAAQPIVAVTQGQAVIVLTAVLMLLYPPASTEAEKTAPRAAMLPLTQLIPVTAVRQTAVLTQVTAATAITAVPM